MKKIDCAWFDIPVTNLDRAITFYEGIFGIKTEFIDAGSHQMAIFPHSDRGGSLMYGPSYEPSTTGPLIYLNANPDLNLVLDRVEQKGGKILMSKTMISEEHGFMATLEDTEGNRVALWSGE